jgi:hypothetical protein
MSETGRKLRMLLVASVLSVPAFMATASAQDRYSPYQRGPYPNTYQDPMSGHIEAEQQHMAGERHHVWHEQRQRDDALRNGDLWGAWARQQHIDQERHHLRHEQEHVDHE